MATTITRSVITPVDAQTINAGATYTSAEQALTDNALYQEAQMATYAEERVHRQIGETFCSYMEELQRIHARIQEIAAGMKSLEVQSQDDPLSDAAQRTEITSTVTIIDDVLAQVSVFASPGA